MTGCFFCFRMTGSFFLLRIDRTKGIIYYNLRYITTIIKRKEKHSYAAQNKDYKGHDH